MLVIKMGSSRTASKMADQTNNPMGKSCVNPGWILDNEKYQTAARINAIPRKNKTPRALRTRASVLRQSLAPGLEVSSIRKKMLLYQLNFR
jgi:hypothetical protein